MSKPYLDPSEDVSKKHPNDDVEQLPVEHEHPEKYKELEEYFNPKKLIDVEQLLAECPKNLLNPMNSKIKK